jgi:putative addiction module component (TIGR02574 family)
MTAAFKQVAQKALALSETDRAHLMRQIVDSLNPNKKVFTPTEWSLIWAAEVEKRMRKLRTRNAKGLPADRTTTKLRAKRHSLRS